MELKLSLTLRDPTDSSAQEKAKEAVKKAVDKRKAATETIEEAWERIFRMKNNETDGKRLRDVKQAMEADVIGRRPADAAKRFSKAEALRLWAELQERQRAEILRKMVEETPSNYSLVTTEVGVEKLKSAIESADIIAIDCETFGEDGGALDPWSGQMAGFSVSTREQSFYVPLNHTEFHSKIFEATVMQTLKKPLENAKVVMHNAPFDAKWFYVHYGINLIDNLHADTRIMAMAMDENRSHRLKDLLTDWLREPSDNFDELFGRTPFNEIPLDVALVYAAGDTEKTINLYDWLMGWYGRREDLSRIGRLVFEIEMPVARQFIWSDIRGIPFDTELAKELDGKFAEEESALESEIYRLLGEEINLNSPAQLSRKLYEDLRLTDYDRGSTGVRSLKRIEREHPVILKILEYREVGKLRNAFTSKLPETVKEDGRIHPWHNSWGAATGRFTCSNPNTQQIPARRSEIRKLFTAFGNDRMLVGMDYSQIELRVLAHYAKDKVLIEAFRLGRDIHSTTASQISGIPYEQIERLKDEKGTIEHLWRERAKTVNFGIVYGMGAAKLADTLGISREEAEKIITDYFKAYPGIKAFMDSQKQTARRIGYVTDIFGRKRRLAQEFKAKERYRHFSAERMAGNFPIQASAGSILKKAVVDLQTVLPQMDVNIVLQVHDELIYDCPRDITEEQLRSIQRTMENAVKLNVPIRCDIDIYPERWAESVPLDEWFAKNN